MLVKLSSKGQLVIPKAIRHALGLRAGDRFQVKLVEHRIVLEPLTATSPIDALYGKYSGCDLLGALEQEHRKEIEDEQSLRA